MGQYFFGLGPGHLSRKVERVAREHGATLVNYTEPNGGKRHWFAAPNMGSPYDERMRDEVMAAINEVV